MACNKCRALKRKVPIIAWSLLSRAYLIITSVVVVDQNVTIVALKIRTAAILSLRTR